MKIICDTHIHSDNSFDAESTVREICLSAVEKELSLIAITDHMEAPDIRLGDKSEYGNLIKQIEKSVKDAEFAQSEFD
jgi:histidinol-phosphatase (PHP family)